MGLRDGNPPLYASTARDCCDAKSWYPMHATYVPWQGSALSHAPYVAQYFEGSCAESVRGGRGVDLHCTCRMSVELPQGQYGPGIGYREYSLLDNPRFHAVHVQPGGNPKLAPPRLAPAVVQVCEVRTEETVACCAWYCRVSTFFVLQWVPACPTCTQEVSCCGSACSLGREGDADSRGSSCCLGRYPSA